jgi:predicted nucleic acid-binding Zn finger protein
VDIFYKYTFMKIAKRETLLAQVKGAIGSKQYQHLYAGEQNKDIVKNGELSCAYFVSSVLHNLELIKSAHATVESTVKDMVKKGWQEVTVPEPGAVIVWSEKNGHKHIGVYIKRFRAISNSEKKTSTSRARLALWIRRE